MPLSFSLRAVALLLASTLSAAAQTYYWSAFAGLPPQFGRVDGAGSAARFDTPFGVVGATSGNVYVTDTLNYAIRRISPNGVVVTVAGALGQRGAVDGPFNVARFATVTGITLVRGNLYVADRGNHAIRQIDTTTGAVTTFAGRLGVPGSADGTASAARFSDPIALANDSAGNLYVADRNNHTIRKITPEGDVTTIAGQAGSSGTTDGTGGAARFNFPCGLTVGPNGVIYVSDTYNHTIRRISPEGAVTTWVGSPGNQGSVNGTGSVARFRFPYGILVYPNGTAIVADNSNSAIRLVLPDGAVSVHTGRLDVQGSRDGARADARFFAPTGLAFTPDGVVVVDTLNHSIRKITGDAFDVSTFAGPGGNFGQQDGTGPAARFNYPNGVAVHSSGDIYLADSRGNTIRRISPAGDVVRIAGSEAGGSASGGDLYIDGPAGANSLNHPYGVAVAPDRTVYFCEQLRHTIRVLHPDGTVATLAGSEGVSGSADGAGNAARFNSPSSIALDKDGNLYIADSSNHLIRKIAAGTNVVSTLAGSTTPGAADGTGAAARFGFPRGVATDGEGNILVADTGNHTIRKITPAGVVSTLAGAALASGSANGSGSTARFNLPGGITVDANGHIYVADTGNQTVRKIVDGNVSTIGGTAGLPNFAEGAGNAAWFFTPTGIAVDSSGNIYLSQAGNNIVAKGEQMTAPRITAQPRSAAIVLGGSATLNVTATGGALAYQWRFNGLPITGATDASYTISNVTTALAGDYTVTITNSLGNAASQPATITIVAASDASRIVNLSIITTVPTPGEKFSLGFVVGGSGTSGNKPLVIRAAGPSLGALGVPGTLDDPRFELFFNSARTGGNDNWGGSDALAGAMQRVGAFAYTGPTSRDAAVSADFSSGNNAVEVSAAGNGTGAVIAEIYDATPSSEFSATTPRLVNISVIKHLGSGLGAGFAIGGLASKTVLIRAVGPTLSGAPFNVGGAVADPQLTLFAGSEPIGGNNNWGGSATLTAAFRQVGAFDLPANSRDAALVTTLQPGTYSVQVSGVGGSGTALIEIYELP